MTKKAAGKSQKAKAKSSAVGYEEVSLDKIPQTKPPGDKDFETIPGAFPDMWEPSKTGDTLIGMLVAAKTIEFGTAKKSELRRIGTFQTADGKRLAYWDCAALRALFDYAKDLLGSWVRIVYKGERKVKGRKQAMKDLEVSLDKHGSEVLRKLMQDVPF